MKPNDDSFTAPPLAGDDTDDDLERVSQIADDVATRLQSGDSVDIDVYISRDPDLESQIRDVFQSLEQVFSIRPSQTSSDPPFEMSLQEDRMIGEYHVIREIGRGGMGIVYEAEQASLGRRVALKVLPFAALLDSKRLERFRNEARAAARLKHPNIVAIHAVGCERGVHFFSMELIDGQSLTDLVSQIKTGGLQVGKSQRPATESTSPTDVDTQMENHLSTEFSGDRRSFFRSVARVGVQAAEALHYAHQEGVIHRDIKLSNLLMDRDGVLHIADFGLARLEQGSDLTVTGDIVGTLRYMSPEQLEPRTLVDQRTDVYSLGLTLYELVTLTPAFNTDEKQHLMRQVLEDELTPIREQVGDVPKDLANIIHKATAKHRNDRYDTAEELADDLNRFVENRPVLARPTSQFGRLRRWVHRNPLVASLGAILFVTLLVAAISGLLGSMHLAKSADRFSKLADDTKLQLYASDIQRAEDLLEEGDIPQAIKLLEHYRPKNDKEIDYRHFEWYYLRSLCDELSPKWTFGHAVSARDAVFSPDGKLLATCAWSKGIDFWDVTTGKKIRSTIKWMKQSYRLHFTNDGKTVISSSWDGTIRFWDVATGDELRARRIDKDRYDGYARDLAVSPNEKWIAVYWKQKRKGSSQPGPAVVRVWDIASRALVAELTGVGKEDSEVHFSPDNNFLIAGSEHGELIVWKCGDWQIQRKIEAHRSRITSVCWSPDSSHVATSSHRIHDRFVRGELKVWDTSNWEEPMVIQHHDGPIREIDFSPDGQWLLVASADSNVSIWSVADGNCVRSFRAHAARVSSARMSPDGSLLATSSADNTVKVWKVADLTKRSKPNTVVRDVEHYIQSVVITPDGKSVVTANRLGKVVIRDLANGEVQREIAVTVPTDWKIEATVSPDSRHLAVVSGRQSIDGKTESGEISIYGLNDGKLKKEISTDKAHMHGFEFSPDGNWLAFGSRRAVHVYDWRTGKIHHTINAFDYVKRLSWSPRRDQLAVCETNGRTSIYSVPKFQLIKKFESDKGWGTIGVDYSPDGRVFATGGGSRVVKIWDSDTFELLQQFDECPDWIFPVEFSHDGERILTGTKDGVLRLWHRKLGVCLLKLYIDDTWIQDGRMSPDGKTIVSGANVLRIWRASEKFKPVSTYTPPPNLPCFQAFELGPADSLGQSEINAE